MTAKLPDTGELERICKGLAALDAVLCEDWESRYYSFNASWAKGERMASMRNGSGDDWFIVFNRAGAFLKSFWHEYKRTPATQIYAGLPAEFSRCFKEPAFSMEWVTFGGWNAGASWQLRGDEGPMAEQLAILSGKPEAYRAYAASYFELEIAVAPIAHVLAGKKIDAKILAALKSDRTLADLRPEFAEIGYGILPS